MAKIKKVDNDILHLSSKHVSGAVHPRLEKHVRKMPQVLRSKDLMRSRRLKMKENAKEMERKQSKIDHKMDLEKEKRSREKYDFPFDSGFLKWLVDEVDYERASEKEKEMMANLAKYQQAYEKQSGKSYKDGSKLGGGGNLGGYSSAYINWLSKKIRDWDGLADPDKLRVLDDARPQSDFTKESGLDPKTGQPVKKDEGKKSGYTAEYIKWIRNELSPKSPSEEEELKQSAKVQAKYTASTGKQPKG